MSPERFTFPVVSFRRIETPYNAHHNNAIAVLHVSKIPDWNSWRKVNVRAVKDTGRVPRAIKDSLTTDSDFLFMNRGLVVSVQDYQFDNKNGTLTVALDDPLVHGLLDGGHTYEIIMQNRDILQLDQYVKVEFLKGFDEDEIVHVVEARNTSNQVQEKSLLNLQGAFDDLKAILEGTPYVDKIAYKENETDKPIDIRELISYLYPFDVTYHNGEGRPQPTKAYVQKAGCLKHFEERQDQFRTIYPIARDIFELWDAIHYFLPELYHEAKGSGRLGRLKGVTWLAGGGRRETQELHFIGQESEYAISDGLKYPILAAFRAFVEVDPTTGEHYWGKGIRPVDMINGPLGQSLARHVGESISDTRNPNKTGKSALLWESCYSTARIVYLER